MCEPVVFRKFPSTNEIIAIFPTIPGTYSPDTCESYMHTGQHGACSPQGMMQKTKPAYPQEYEGLKRELESEPFGYRLEIRQRISRKDFIIRQLELADMRERALLCNA